MSKRARQADFWDREMGFGSGLAPHATMGARSPLPIITSETHPFTVYRVSRMALTGYPGSLGIAAAPGRVARTSREGPLARDLDADLLRLREHYKCGHLVSLVEGFELRENGIVHLGERAVEHGIAFHRFPLVDLQAPKSHELDAWDALVTRLWAAVCQGQGVVTHCRGGRGRSGTLAAAILMRFGWSAAEAVALLRVSRPDAVDSAQLAFLSAKR